MGKAVCIGINKYPDPSNWLNGCVNDAKDWAAFLAKRGFSVLPVMLDRDATKRNMIEGMRTVVQSLKAGETGVITYSGHGTWMPDLDGDEPDKRDEALCPWDMGETNILLDDEIHAILMDRVAGSRVVLVTDSCHSATVFRIVGRPGLGLKARYIPPVTFVTNERMLKKIAQVEKRNRAPAGIHPTNAPLPGVIHFGGCNDNSYSYDATFRGRPNGAFTYWALKALLSYPTMVSYADFFRDVQKKLPSDDYPQTPHFNAEAADKRRVAFSPT